MYYYRVEQDEFYEFLYKNIGKNLEVKTHKGHLTQKIEKIVFPKQEINRFEKLFSKYNTIEYYFEEDQEYLGYIRLTYLVQYYWDSNERDMYECLFDDIVKIRDSIWDIYDENILDNDKNETYSVFDDFDWEKFKTAKIKEEVYYYMIFDSQTKGEVEKVLYDIYNEKPIITEIDVINEKFGIDGLCYVALKREDQYFWEYARKYNIDVFSPKADFYKWEQVTRRLSRLRIPVCFYVDRYGEVKIVHSYNVIIPAHKSISIKKNGVWKEDLNRIFMSSWEANIARLFNYKNIDWEYESKSYKLKTHKNSTEAYPYGYTPDFHIFDNNIIEIKGLWDTNSLDVITSFDKEYPEYNYSIIDGDMYYTLEKLYSDIIPNWEKSNVKQLVIKNIKLVGITLEERIEFVKKLRIGDKVLLERDKNNIYDKNAIKVLDQNRNLLGYISKQWATILSKKIDLGMEYDVVVKVINKKVIDLELKRINLDEEIIYPFLRIE